MAQYFPLFLSVPILSPHLENAAPFSVVRPHTLGPDVQLHPAAGRRPHSWRRDVLHGVSGKEGTKGGMKIRVRSLFPRLGSYLIFFLFIFSSSSSHACFVCLLFLSELKGPCLQYFTRCVSAGFSNPNRGVFELLSDFLFQPLFGPSRSALNDFNNRTHRRGGAIAVSPQPCSSLYVFRSCTIVPPRAEHQQHVPR